MFGHDGMDINKYLFLLQCLLLAKLKSANHKVLTSPKTVFINIISLPHVNLQYPRINQPIPLAFKAYLSKLIFDNFDHKLWLTVTYSFKSHHLR